MQNDALQTDVFIAGGGPVGLMLALGLAQKGFEVVMAEPVPLADAPEQARNSFDGRVLALSYGSRKILESLGVWEALRAFVTPIEHVHVSQKGYLGITLLHADEVGVPALGYSVQSSDLGKVLWQAVQGLDKIKLLCPARLVDFSQDDRQVVAKLQAAEHELTVLSKLIVGADGTESLVRKVLGLEIQQKSYHAYGVIAQITTREHPQGWSFERFTGEGPVALLPMQGHAHKAVLVCPEEQLDSVMALDDAAFMALFASKMGERLGGFCEVSPRVAYPLKETYVPQMTQARALLMGNASHTQHPVAAQGLNLGIRDIGEFLQGLNAGQDPGEINYLQTYASARAEDHEKVMGLTDSLIQVFQHHSPLVGHLRGIGLMALQAMPGLKKRFARFAMGGSEGGASRGVPR
ncbi:FAD-dependent monooxygenase [Thiomicrorhabdus cannonii]|uniref:FAD-dependent monooxygenase n=1 Tax=Thiomicrorhabdus cannonii TaxID=2748011 RepID=UPI0015BAC2E7|nr:FAD-dependent monooxygenase [Thiomicrorhabdus cannonii]